MIRYEINRVLPNINRLFYSARKASTSNSQINIEKLEQESTTTTIDVIDEEARNREEELERKRNKSRLKAADRNFLFEQDPYPEPTRWHQGTLKYMRRLYGRYGEASGVNPSLCWPVKEELEEAKEYERVAYPFTIPEMIKTAKQARVEKDEKIRKRQEDIIKKIEKLEQWKQDLHNKIAKKEGDIMAAKQRKERLIEEVRMHFGYTVDPKDEKFKEMVEKKEKEQKKAAKEERKKAREESLMAKMLSKKTEKKQPATSGAGDENQ